MPEPQQPQAAPTLAPVDVPARPDDAVSRGLEILATVYHYNHWIFDQVREHLGKRVVEVGSGIGNITQFLLNVDEVVCLEPFEPYCRHLRSRFAPHRNVRVVQGAIEQCPGPEVPAGQFDTVVCLNVLEHIEDDVSALRRMRELLAPGGRVIVLVPALHFLYGQMDRALGHVRRYSRRSLRGAFRQAGLRPVSARYLNALGMLGWWWHGRVRGRTVVPVGATRLFDRMVPFLAAWERLVPPLIGQSVVMVGQA